MSSAIKFYLYLSACWWLLDGLHVHAYDPDGRGVIALADITLHSNLKASKHLIWNLLICTRHALIT